MHPAGPPLLGGPLSLALILLPPRTFSPAPPPFNHVHPAVQPPLPWVSHPQASPCKAIQLASKSKLVAWLGFLLAWASPLSPSAWVLWTLPRAPTSQPATPQVGPQTLRPPNPSPDTSHLLVFCCARHSWITHRTLTYRNKQQRQGSRPLVHCSDPASPCSQFPTGTCRL